MEPKWEINLNISEPILHIDIQQGHVAQLSTFNTGGQVSVWIHCKY